MEEPKKKREKQSNVVFRFIATVYINLFLLLVMILGLGSQIVCFFLFFPLIICNKKARVTIFGYCFRICMYFILSPLNPFWKLKIIRKPKKGYKTSKTLLFVNHLSSLDPWIVNACTLQWNLKYVFKASLFRIPIGGQALYLSGDIPIYFTKGKGGWEIKPGGVAEIMKMCKEYQDMNIGTVVFPEGTRSLTGQLQFFKAGFFKFAIENNCEILPCALHASGNLWNVKSKLFGIGTVYLSFGEPFHPAPGMTVDELKEKTRNAIFELIKEFPDYDPETDKLATEMTKSRGHGL
ncbi:1-acyl-sn-glycerol-3-phosphate acyltransferase [Plasmodium inui San Antonio 1]|uniref:1-acyl-sn-glycerol-3-phosphate acyltransferase n=1 Tax=Plasmodium inui San Antonio 1 TaxID=1237626 RepID=W7A8D3_9APIC|nr:1-acyl-sn-glycerol-3-phosphate acyltransferase [Plasmodium inui San Antonio 1]EUD69482.1 1-acyl-sn-glycerol-3-phosphate acyltransferase [Plasmodium inui San Antonio 1]